MIDKQINKLEIQKAKEWIKIQLKEMNPDTKGIMTFTYGNENYMVSTNAGKRIAKEVIPSLQEKFPDIVFLFIPFWVEASDIKELNQVDR